MQLGKRGLRVRLRERAEARDLPPGPQRVVDVRILQYPRSAPFSDLLVAAKLGHEHEADLDAFRRKQCGILPVEQCQVAVARTFVAGLDVLRAVREVDAAQRAHFIRAAFQPQKYSRRIGTGHDPLAFHALDFRAIIPLPSGRPAGWQRSGESALRFVEPQIPPADVGAELHVHHRHRPALRMLDADDFRLPRMRPLAGRNDLGFPALHPAEQHGGLSPALLGMEVINAREARERVDLLLRDALFVRLRTVFARPAKLKFVIH